MKDEVGVLIGLTYLIKQYNDRADFNRTNGVSCFLGLLGREHMVWKQESKASSSNTSESQFLRNNLTVVPFKITIIRSPELPQ